MAGSPLIGFGTPPPNVQINFSILDFFGLDDQTIPYSLDTAYGIGPHDSLISHDGYYYEDKIRNLNEWSDAMKCADEEAYPTQYDGIDNFQCLQRKCERGTSLVRCNANYGHEYPLWNYENTAAARIAWDFMKNHPRN